MTKKKKEDPRGLLFIWTDIDEDYRLEYQKWHSCEHVPERLMIPGFYAARRYGGLGNAPNFLNLYETFDLKVLASEPYLRAKNNPTPWTREVIAHFRNNGRNIVGLVAESGNKPTLDAPYLFVMRFNPPLANRKEVIAWYSQEYLPKVCRLDGVYRGRLYEVDVEISGIPTAEQKISGSTYGRQMFLALFEIASSALPASTPWQEVQENSDHTKEMMKKLEDVQQELYWLQFTMYAPPSSYLKRK